MRPRGEVEKYRITLGVGRGLEQLILPCRATSVADPVLNMWMKTALENDKKVR